MAFSFNEDSYNSNETASHISLNSIHFTSPFASTNSDVDGLSNTNASREIIYSYVSEDDAVRINLMSYVVNSLYDQISILKDDIVFLRAESKSKSSTIGQLFSELAELRKNNDFHRSALSDSSIILHELMSRDVQVSTLTYRDTPANALNSSMRENESTLQRHVKGKEQQTG